MNKRKKVRFSQNNACALAGISYLALVNANHLAVIERRMIRQNSEIILAKATGRDISPIVRRAAKLGNVWRVLRQAIPMQTP